MNYSLRCLRQRMLFPFCAFLFLWFSIVPQAAAQTVLSPGDLVLVNVNSDDDDNFDFIPLVDLQAGTEIKFTDDAWDPTNSQFRGREGIITYTAVSAVSAGTVVSYSGSDGNGFTRSGSFNTSGGGDNILVYQGDESTPTFFYGAGFARESSVWNYDGDTNSSGLPSNLSEANNTILSLGTTHNYRYDTANGTEGTPQTLLELVGDGNNWEEENDNAFSALRSGFTILSTPTLAFSTSTQTGDEGTTVTLIVELAEADNQSVDVDVVFSSNGSTATPSDLNGFSSNTVSFSSASAGDQQTVQITLAGGDGYENGETAVFQLQNNSTGAIIDPDVLTLTINDDENPAVVINEILYNPPSDANGDGTTDTSGDEFIEFINDSGSSLDISGWTVSDGGGVKYTFPDGSIIPAGKAFVVFADPALGTGFGGAYLYSAGSLSLNNDGDNIILKDADGATVTSYNYSGSQSDESITRNPDINGSFEGHTSADSNDDRSPYSPGTQIDGTPFGAAFAIGMRGSEGWRFVGSPAKNTTFNDLFADLWTQGINGSDAPSVSSSSANVYSWNENSGAFGVIGSMTNEMAAGQGYIVYVYEDDDYRTPGVQGGFPKIIDTNNSENDKQVNVDVSVIDANNNGSIDGNEGFNLLSNPFGTDISVDAVISALENVNPNVSTNISIWDDNAGSGNGGYVTLSPGSNETIVPFQAFFVRFTDEVSSTEAIFNVNNMAANRGAEFYDQPGENIQAVSFEIYLGDGDKFDTYSVSFRDNGTIGEDRYDAYKLFSLNSDAISLFSTVGSDVRLAKNVLPPVDALQGELRIPLTFDVPRSGEYNFSWNDLQDIPANIELQLVDNETGSSVDLRNAEGFSFNVATSNTPNRRRSGKYISPTSSQDKTAANNSRFELIVSAASLDEEDQTSPNEPVVLSPNYPNPFSTQTTMELELNQEMHVKATIWNIVAQKVATLADRVMSDGEQLTWNVPSSMPSGIYICKVEAGGKVITRKMTLVK